MSRTAWIAILVGVAALLAVVLLPLLGVALVFRHEIGQALFGPGEPTSGTRLVYTCTPLPGEALEGAAAPDLDRVCDVIRRRLDPSGRRGVVVRPEGAGLIEVLVHADADVASVKRRVASPGLLEFRFLVDREADRGEADFEAVVRRKKAGQDPGDPRFRWYPCPRAWEWYTQGLLDAWHYVYVIDEEAKTVEALVDVSDGQNVTGRDLASARPSSMDGEPVIAFDLEPAAAGRMARLTRPENHGRHLAIILDGEIQSAPVVRATLSTSGIIEGYETLRERDEIVDILRAGPLGANLRLVSEERFGPPGEGP
jgi:preprotein translocase subunit SecD